MKYQILTIASRRSLNSPTTESVAISQQVIPFESSELADTAYENLIHAKQNKGVSVGVSLDVIKLY